MKCLILLLLTFTVKAQVISKPWIKATPPGFKMSAAYMNIKNNTDTAIYLENVETKIAEFPELHTHNQVNGVMKMRQVKKILIKPQQIVALKPKSFHIMLIQLTRSLKVDEKIKLKLIFSNGKKVNVIAPVKKIIK